MKHKKLKIAVAIGTAALLVTLITVSVFAYFSTLAYVYTSDGDKQVAHLGMNLSLLFDKLVPQGTTTDTQDGVPNNTVLPFVSGQDSDGDPIYYTYDSSATWGTAQNPYIISDIRHLQNLSALQDIGYFYKLNIVNNFNTDSDGNITTYNGGNDKPYFLVCTPKGKPTTIDGTGIKIKPIGTDEYPFIGEIGGAFVEGTTTVKVKKNGTDTDLQSDTSAIFNITVMSKRKMPDHGLFGYVSYLGQDPSELAQTATTFQGYVSKISNLLVADVTLEVKDTNFVDTVADWISTHIFSYKELSAAAQATVPHETHHIGILAGHVNYVDVANISVYYSSDDIVCIDLNDKKTVVGTGTNDDTSSDGFDNNYFSSTGIIGYIYSMNPQYNGNTITIGTGSSSTSVGSLGGGGQASGVNPGYVLAVEMYKTYIDYSAPPALTADKLPTYTLDDQLGIMIYASLDNLNQPMFMDELGRQLFPVVDDGRYGYYVSGGWRYKQEKSDGTFEWVTLEDTPFFYCQEEINMFDADGNFQSAPVYYTTITGKEEYTLENNGEEYKFTRLTGTKLNIPAGEKPTMDVTTSNNNLYLYTAKDSTGKALCTQWYRDRLILSWFGEFKEATGRYYFYDGVFTFALSNMRDVIREIWPMAGAVSTIPNILLAEDWTVGKQPNDYTYKTFFTPVTGTTLDSKKRYVLAYQTADDYYIISLIGGTNSNNGGLNAVSFNSLISGKETSNSGNSFVVDVGKSGQQYFDDYLMSGTGQIKSTTQTDIKLGVYAYCGQLTGQNFYPYSGNAEDTDGELGQKLVYSYNSSLVAVTGGWQVKFTNVRYKNYSWFQWEDEVYSQRFMTYSVDSNQFGLGNSSGTTFQLFEVHNEIATISPDDADNALVPADGTNKVNEPLSAKDYVLWPQQTTSGSATTTTTTYSLFHVGKLGVGEDGNGTWRYENGKFLYQMSDALKYMFSMTEGAKYGTVNSNTLGGDWDGGDAFVKATLGTDGSETFIPMGCISFKVNKDPDPTDPIKIRVIVAVPTSDSVNGLTYNEDYYFGLWKNSVAAGQNQTFNFEKNGTIAKFELPRSQPLFNGQESSATDTVGANNPIRVQYDANNNGVIDTDTEGTYYNTYFQGETVLVAYEFTVTEAGVYTLGATNGPMQIVYFSADGVASMGRDGTGGAYLQGIDFVYDNYGYTSSTTTTANTNKIITVNNAPEDSADTEDYNFYYESSCILFFDNEVKNQTKFVNIYHEKIYVRRWIDESLTTVQKTKLTLSVTEGSELSTLESNRYVKLERYAQKSDTVDIKEYTVSQPTSP